MKTLFSYLQTKKRIILAVLLCAALFIVSFLLYRLPFKAVLYPMLLCFATLFFFMLFDYLWETKRASEIKRLASLSPEEVDALPEAATLTEAAYRELADSLRNEIAEKSSKSAAEYREMIDYYTVWAHQIKTPISSMKLALQEEDTPLARRLSADILCTQRYVDMVLAFLRLDPDASDYVLREQDIDRILKSSIRKFAPDFIGRKLSLLYEPVDFTAVTDEKWFAFVFEQLLSNALKYTAQGGIRIYAEGRTLCIEDTGIGIAPEDLPRVFEKGYTGLNGRTEASSSGLGLYLCSRICTNLGIGLRIESKIGEGTNVYLDLSQQRIRE